MQTRRCHSAQQRSRHDPFPLWQQHQYRPPYPLGHTQSFTAVRTLLRPHHDCGNSHVSDAPNQPRRSRKPSHTSGQVCGQIAGRVFGSGCSLSLVLDGHTSMASLLQDTSEGNSGKPTLSWVTSLSTSSLMSKDLGGSETQEGEFGHPPSLLMETLRRTGMSRSPMSKVVGRGSRLLNSRASSSGNVSLATHSSLLKESQPQLSLYSDEARSVCASKAHSTAATLDTGETLIIVCALCVIVSGYSLLFSLSTSLPASLPASQRACLLLPPPKGFVVSPRRA